MSVIPRRRTRRPEECKTLVMYQAADVMMPDGAVETGERFEFRARPGRWWEWLGRRWFFREWVSR